VPKVIDNGEGWHVELKEPLLQRDVEAVADALQGKANLPVIRWNGELVRAAVAAGWVEKSEPVIAEVGDLPPPYVRWLANEINAYYAAVMEIPKE